MVGEGFALAREELIRTLTAYSGVTTADGSSDKNTLIDSALAGKNDFLTGKSILIMSGAAQYETSGITAFYPTAVGVHVAGEITVATPFSAQIVTGVSFRVLNVLPESVHISSGQVQIMGYDYESGEWRSVRVTGSGEIAIHITIADIVTAKISGQSVVVTSGQVVAKVSGETVIAKVSGETVIGKVSGETVTARVSGVVAVVSGEVHVLSGQLIAKVSGETVIAKISGETVIAKVSGETVTAKVSGETVSIEIPTLVKTGPIQVITASSGGQVLYSGAIKSAVVKALTDNSGMIALGGVTDRPWYEAVCSGQGLILDGAEAVSLDVDNFDRIYVVAEVSGDQVSFVGVD